MIIAAVVQAVNFSYPKPNQENREQKNRSAFREPIVLATVGICVATAVGVVVAAFQWNELRKTDKKIGQQVEALDRQLRLMEADQRPWIKVDIKISGPFEFSQGWGKVPIEVNMTNVGKSPAFNVQPFHWPFLMAADRTNMTSEWNSRCKYAQAAPLDNPARGFILFPGEGSSMENAGLGFLSVIVLSPADIEKAIKGTDGSLDIWFYGCVLYNFGSIQTLGQTGFAYRIGRLFDRENLPTRGLTFSFIPTEGVISIDDLRLFRSPSSSGQTF